MASRTVSKVIDKLRDAAARPVEIAPAPAGGDNARRTLAAVLVRNPADLEREFSRAADAAHRLDGSDLRVFAENVHEPGFPICTDRPGSLYAPWSIGVFDRVWIGRTVRLYDNPWGWAFISRADRMLRDGGELLLAVDKSSRTRGIMPLSAVQRVAGDSIDVCKAVVSRMPAGVEYPDSPSVMSWYLDHAGELMVEDLMMRTFGPGHTGVLDDPICPEFMRPSPDLDATERKADPASSAPDDLLEALGKAMHRQTYQVGGMSHKSALMRHIITEQIGTGRDLAMADMGGGYGLLAAEMILDPACPVSKATNVDLNLFNIALSVSMYRGLRAHLAGRFSCWFGPAQQYRADEPLDVVSFIGSLLYIPRQIRREALDRAWEALSPGGLLVVHENIKNENYKADYDKMFTADEIDSLLARYGTITRYHTTSTEKCSPREAGDKSLYRVIAKAG